LDVFCNYWVDVQRGGMEILKYKLVYDGGEASDGRLPAHNGATSLEGMTWTFSLIGHYAATGKIRTRGELSSIVRTYLAPPQRGSYIQELWVFITEPQNIFITSALGVYTVNTVSQALNSLIVSSVRQVCGLAVELLRKEENFLERLPPGDKEALIDKIEPSMKRAHTVIEEGATKLDLRKGQSTLATFDASTKRYVNVDILTDEQILKVSVGAYNANSGNGSAYIPDIGKTVPFFAPKGLDAKTYSALSYSLDRYVNSLPSLIEIACEPTVSLDNRIKRLRIVRAFKTNE
jgi:hypothetical protein